MLFNLNLAKNSFVYLLIILLFFSWKRLQINAIPVIGGKMVNNHIDKMLTRLDKKAEMHDIERGKAFSKSEDLRASTGTVTKKMQNRADWNLAKSVHHSNMSKAADALAYHIKKWTGRQ